MSSSWNMVDLSEIPIKVFTNHTLEPRRRKKINSSSQKAKKMMNLHLRECNIFRRSTHILCGYKL